MHACTRGKIMDQWKHVTKLFFLIKISMCQISRKKKCKGSFQCFGYRHSKFIFRSDHRLIPQASTLHSMGIETIIQSMFRQGGHGSREPRRILESKRLLPPLRVPQLSCSSQLLDHHHYRHLQPRDEQFILAPPDVRYLVLWGFLRGTDASDRDEEDTCLVSVQELVEELRKSPNNLHVSFHNGDYEPQGDQSLTERTTQKLLFDSNPQRPPPPHVVVLPESYMQDHVDDNGNWCPSYQPLVSHFFHLGVHKDCSTILAHDHDARISKFLHNHDDLVCCHAFPRNGYSVSQMAQDFLLHHATLEKLDTRRMTWISKNVPTYCSKQVRRGNVNPFDKNLAPCRVAMDPDLVHKYTVVNPNRDDNNMPSSCRAINSNLESIDQFFDLRRFEMRKSPPVLVDEIVDRSSFCSDQDLGPTSTTATEPLFQCQDMMIKAPGEQEDVLLPQELRGVAHEFVQKSMAHFCVHSKQFHDYYAYLTVTRGSVPRWGTQRRPGLHADGFFSDKHSPLVNNSGGGAGGGSDSFCGQEVNEMIYLACSSVPPVFYLEGFSHLSSDLDRRRHDFWVAMATRTRYKPQSCMQPFDVVLMDGYCPHAVATHRSLQPLGCRTFVRLVFSQQRYRLLGNTCNPHFVHLYEDKDSWEWVEASPVQAPAMFWSALEAMVNDA